MGQGALPEAGRLSSKICRHLGDAPRNVRVGQDTYICMYNIYIYIYTHMYIERERETKKEYIYIYRERER